MAYDISGDVIQPHDDLVQIQIKEDWKFLWKLG